MMTTSTYLSALAAALTLALAGCATPTAPAAAASAGVSPTTSEAEADAKLADVAQRRQVAEALYATRERECHTRFFVNRCLDQAREQRRATLAGLRAIEVEANHFKRVESVERRDAALAERQRQDERDAAARAVLPLKTPRLAPAEPERAAPAKAEAIEKRQAEREARELRRQEREAAGAGQRAANVAAFKRKQQEAAARQRAVAEKQAAKAAKEAQGAPRPEAVGK